MTTEQKTLNSHSHLQLRVSWTWFILALLVVWTLAVGYFPTYDLSLPAGTYWLMALAAAVGLFVSIVLHELCHSVVARAYGLGGRRITLFIFGGVSDLEKEPTTPSSEFWVAVVGPVMSAVLGFIFATLDNYGMAQGWDTPVTDVFYYLSYFNYVIAVFNMVPAFPLDGGRILRSILWAFKKDIKWATRIASTLGVAFGIFMMIIGVLQFFSFNIFNGVWLFVLGLFLTSVARGSYSQLLVTRLLAHEPVQHAMKQDLFSVRPETSLRELANDVYKYHSKLFPVTEGDRLLGCVGVRELRRIPEMQWPTHTVSEFTESCSPENVIGPEEDLVNALKILNKSGADELIVADHGKLLGKVSARDILDFFSLKMELEEGRAS